MIILLSVICLLVGGVIGSFLTKGSNMSTMTIVENKARHKMANDHYWHLRAMKKDEVVDYLFTDTQLKRGEERAIKNPEDLPS